MIRHGFEDRARSQKRRPNVFGVASALRAGSSAKLDESTVRNAYRRWAPVYDQTFGRFAAEGRRHAVEVINRKKGRVLEVGVGTGLSLSMYAKHLEIVGIDLSPEMLDKARARAMAHGLSHVRGLHEMDAGALTFPSGSFDIVVAMYVMTVVPDPEKVMRELARVCKPGGEVILVNHFSRNDGVRGWVERRMAPFADKLGWRPVFDHARVMVCDDLKLIQRRSLRPFGLFTMMRFAKGAAGHAYLSAAE
ncbi:MAG TPA: methyltransferase domain-containing protein [Hyphomicrobiaceae bacterium]|nr:methyltransferase domain-containing protein [Hyphomicrobiaceae bacterium]